MNRKSKNILHNSVQIKAEKKTVFSLSEAFEPLGHPPFFFFRLASNAFPDIRSVGGIEKKKPEKKSQRSLGTEGPGTPE